jgi:hypothetical protein
MCARMIYSKDAQSNRNLLCFFQTKRAKEFYTLKELHVEANVQLKSSIPIGAKLENQPQGFFTLGVKAENRKKYFSICPQDTNKC